MFFKGWMVNNLWHRHNRILLKNKKEQSIDIYFNSDDTQGTILSEISQTQC